MLIVTSAVAGAFVIRQMTSSPVAGKVKVVPVPLPDGLIGLSSAVQEYREAYRPRFVVPAAVSPKVSDVPRATGNGPIRSSWIPVLEPVVVAAPRSSFVPSVWVMLRLSLNWSPELTRLTTSFSMVIVGGDEHVARSVVPSAWLLATFRLVNPGMSYVVTALMRPVLGAAAVPR
ncbi:Uncharacterised protein [Mycobacteroides abscessus subsp. abscessus]|nr:Uncharacterised protein [Mycobacteroides abscessus subsp. abscessus]